MTALRAALLSVSSSLPSQAVLQPPELLYSRELSFEGRFLLCSEVHDAQGRKSSQVHDHYEADKSLQEG